MKRAQQAEMFAARTPKPVSSQARAMCSRGKKPAPAPKPWQCSILAVDTAENSGWSVWVDGTLVSSGETDTRDEARMLKIASWPGSHTISSGPPVLVLEAPYGGPKHAGEVKTLIALGMARERWLRAWKDAGEARARVVLVQPATWRAAVLGNVRGLKTPALNKLEQQVAKRISGRDCRPDEAAAVCVGAWASYAAAVGEVIGKKAREASMEAWQR